MRLPRFSLRCLLIAPPLVVAVLGFAANLVYNNLTEILLPAAVQARRDAVAADIEPRLRADGFLSPKVFIGGWRNNLTGRFGHDLAVVTEGAPSMPGSLSVETARALCKHDLSLIAVANPVSPEVEQVLETRYALESIGPFGTNYWRRLSNR